ncbi:MAG: hypothetical protein WAT66_03820 [Actinomycetota bacterium]
MARDRRTRARTLFLVAIATLPLVVLPMRDALAVHSVGSVTPSSRGQGATAQDLEITGSGFLPDASVGFSGTGITVNNATRNSATSITANVTIAGNAPAGARNVTVSQLGGLDSASCTNCFTVNAAPTVASASPNTLGQGASNATVTITGTGFVSGATVSVSGTGVTVGTVTFVNATTLTAPFSVTSGAATTARDITVTNADAGVGTCTGCLTISTGPTISNVSPGAGSNTGSLDITVTGTNFASGRTVFLRKTNQDDIVGTVKNSPAPTSTSFVATVNLTLAAPGTWDVVVTNPDKGSATCACFTVAGAAPTVTDADPDHIGQGAVGAEVDLTGTNFAHGAMVSFSGTGITVTDVVVNSAVSLTVTINVSTSAATTARDITVLNTDGQEDVCTGCLTIATGPTATSVDPTAYGQRATDQPFEITGTGFVDGATVSFSGTGVTVGAVTVDSPTSISTTISVSATAAATARDVIVTNPDLGAGTCAGCFTVHAAPTVSALNPSAIGQGVTDQDIAVTGTGFVNGAGATFSGTGVTVNNVTVNSGTSITINVDVASDAALGTRDLTVTNPDAGNVTCTACLTINLSPAITSASPDHLGRGAASKVVSLTGTGFVAASDVDISGTGVTVNNVAFVDASHLHVTMTVSDAATLGDRTFTVTNPDGGVGSCADCFAITAAPIVTSADPDALGQGASGVEVTLDGSGFVAGATISVSGSGVTVVGSPTVDAADQITVVLDVASGAATGARDITVTNTDFGTSTCDDCLTINGAPTVSNVSPAAASNTGTSVLTLTGTGFVDGATVTLTKTGQDAIDADPVEFVSPTSVKATVDLTLAAPGAWVVNVENPDHGTGACTTCFTVAGATPTVTSADPDHVGPGATAVVVELTGTSFANGATVVVSGTGVTVGAVDVIDASHIEVPLTVATTAAAGARNVTVTNTDGQSGTCTGCLTITAPPTITSISPAQRGQGLTNQTLSITGTGFQNGIDATFSGTGITVNSVTFGNVSNITVNIDVAGGASLGSRDVTLTNPDGGTKTCAACFAVTGPTTVTITGPSALTGSNIATFSQPVSGVSSSNFTLEVTGSGSPLAGTVSCKGATGLATSCTSGSVRTAFLKPSSALIAGQQYTAKVPDGSPAITDFGGLTVAPQSLAFRASTIEQESSTGARYNWRNGSSSSALGGTYAVDHISNARAVFRFSGSSVVWYTNTGPSYGTAKVYIDSRYRGTFNQYASSNHYRVGRSFSSLGSGSHVLVVIVQGKKGSTSGTGTNVAVDAFRVGTTLVRTPALSFTWGTVGTSAASGGKYVRSDLRNSAVSFVFRGTGIDWYTVTGRGMGKAEIYIDGVLKATVDNYASSTHYGVARAIRGLSDGVHTIRIRVLGTHRSGATGNLIAADRWQVI